MSRSAVRVFDRLPAFLIALTLCATGAASAQQSAPQPLWFQGTRLIFEHAVPMQGDLGVSTRDAGMRR